MRRDGRGGENARVWRGLAMGGAIWRRLRAGGDMAAEGRAQASGGTCAVQLEGWEVRLRGLGSG